MARNIKRISEKQFKSFIAGIKDKGIKRVIKFAIETANNTEYGDLFCYQCKFELIEITTSHDRACPVCDAEDF